LPLPCPAFSVNLSLQKKVEISPDCSYEKGKHRFELPFIPTRPPSLFSPTQDDFSDCGGSIYHAEKHGISFCKKRDRQVVEIPRDPKEREGFPRHVSPPVPAFGRRDVPVSS